jgi:hypothetical protein
MVSAPEPPITNGRKLLTRLISVRTERRISYDGRGQRSSRSATGILERERTERQFGMHKNCAGDGRVRIQIS